MIDPIVITKDKFDVRVNRASESDDNVVFSFTVDGKRRAIGLSPREARNMARALQSASEFIEYGRFFA